RKEQDEERPASRTHEQELAEQNQGAAASTTNDFSCFYLDEELPDLGIESSSKTTAPTEEATISGRRIITPSHFIKCLRELEQHECVQDRHGRFIFDHERRVGLWSEFVYICNECGAQRTVSTDPVPEPTSITTLQKKLGVNDAAVWAFM
ncbi:hypothetical protein HPB47_015427, partial [Ixodes persulcatus]